MIHAYDKIYLEKARVVLARMMDFAVYDLHYKMNDFFDLFLASGIAARFERGDFTVLVGKSGVELAYEVLEKSGVSIERMKPKYTLERSEEYWTGWALAYYQWETGLRFEEIEAFAPIHYIQALYSPYHEMDIKHFVEKMNELYRQVNPETNLKKKRQMAGLSQRELAEISGIPLRTIQQYEQRQKNINHAKVEYLIQLSNALCCEVEVLVERIN